MFLRQIHDPHLSQYAYLIGCQKSGEAIVIDPLRDMEHYREIANQEGLHLSAVAETHIHADFVSGARELAMTGSEVYVSAEGGPDWQSEWTDSLPRIHHLKDRDVFHIGKIRFEVIHTPGHTPEHLCYLVTDEGGGADEPIALISGDFLFVGDVGRPDLLEQAAGITGAQERGASQLYHSLRKLNSLPDHIQVLPGHGAGSSCGKSLGAVPSSTLGYEKRFNHALKLALQGNEKDFTSFILEGQPEPPLYFAHMKRVNKSGPALLKDIPLHVRTSASEVGDFCGKAGVVILDSRSDKASFLANHLKGSLFAPAKGDFCGFAGSCLKPEESVILVVEDPALADHLVTLLHRIGFDHVRAWISADELSTVDSQFLGSIPSIRFEELEDHLSNHPGTAIIDVRRSGEYRKGHLRNALNIAHTRLRARSSSVPGLVPLVVHCQSGMRATCASALLNRLGHEVTCVNDSFENVPGEMIAS